MLSSGHGMKVAHLNSEQLWLSMQDLYKIKPVKNFNMEQGEDPNAPSLAEETMANDGC